MLSRRWLAPRVLAVLLPACASTLAAQDTCTPAVRDSLLREEQKVVLAKYDVPDPLRALAARGWIPAHYLVSNYGYGMAMAPASALVSPPAEPVAGEPILLMYRPREGANGLDHVPDPPYVLVGWGYGTVFDPARKPAMGCMLPSDDFFIHEAGYHTPDGGFAATPPEEEVPGSAVAVRPVPPTTVGVWHARFWDVHLWVNRDGGGVPVVRPCLGEPIPGLSLAAEGFFIQGTGEAVGCAPPESAGIRDRNRPARARHPGGRDR